MNQVAQLFVFLQVYNDIIQILRSQSFVTVPINTMIITTTMTATSTQPYQFHLFDQSAFKTILYEILGFFLLSLLSLISYYLKKCYQNNGKCKVRIIKYCNMHIINMLFFSAFMVYLQGTNCIRTSSRSGST
jgi:hypothetical protein